jgi:hypothetical protein
MGLYALDFFVGPVFWSWFIGNRPINFYARVTDVKGNPLSGITVPMTIIVGDPNRSGIVFIEGQRTIDKQIQAITDSKGEFSVTNERGYCLTMGGFVSSGYIFKVRTLPIQNAPGYFKYGNGYGHDNWLPSNPNQRVTLIMEPYPPATPQSPRGISSGNGVRR